jgi:hypothetical protein
LDWDAENRYATVDGEGDIDVRLELTYEPVAQTLDVSSAELAPDPEPPEQAVTRERSA